MDSICEAANLDILAAWATQSASTPTVISPSRAQMVPTGKPSNGSFQTTANTIAAGSGNASSKVFALFFSDPKSFS